MKTKPTVKTDKLLEEIEERIEKTDKITKPLEDDKKASENFLMVKLDKNTILVASPHSFVIRERTKTKDGDLWVGKYYYSEIGDAVRGYARHMLRRPEEGKKLDGNMQTLINQLAAWETAIREVGQKIAEKWEAAMSDPVEAMLMKKGMKKNEDD